MNIECTDGVKREFSSLYDHFVILGFDPLILDEDGGFVELGLPPGVNFRNAIDMVRQGGVLDSWFCHKGRRNQKRNPIFVSIPDLLSRFDWLAVSQSFGNMLETDVNKHMDFITKFSRRITYIYDFLAQNHGRRYSFNNYISGLDREKFKFGFGYKKSSHYFSREAGMTCFLIEDFDGQKYIVNSSILGYLKYIYVA
jgi:hypothetical protein